MRWTFDSEGQNCQDVCTLLGATVQFLTDNISNAPQEFTSNFQTLVEDQAQKFVVFQLKTVEAAIGFRAEGDHGHAAQAKVDLGWISKLVQGALLAFPMAEWVTDMQELVAALHKRIHSAVFSRELWTKLGRATTQLANGKHPDDAEWLELQRQLELADQQHKGQHVIERMDKLLVEIVAFSLAKATTSWTQAIAVAQMLVHVCALSCYISMRALQTYEGQAWDEVPLSSEWMTAMAPLVRDAQRGKDLRAQLDTLVAQALSFRNPFLTYRPFRC